MQWDSLEYGTLDHEPVRRAPPAPERMEEGSPDHGHAATALRQERDSDRHPVAACDLRRSELLDGPAPSPGWHRLPPAGPGNHAAGAVVVAQIRADRRRETRGRGVTTRGLATGMPGAARAWTIVLLAGFIAL